MFPASKNTILLCVCFLLWALPLLKARTCLWCTLQRASCKWASPGIGDSNALVAIAMVNLIFWFFYTVPQNAITCTRWNPQTFSAQNGPCGHKTTFLVVLLHKVKWYQWTSSKMQNYRVVRIIRPLFRPNIKLITWCVYAKYCMLTSNHD